MWGADRDIRRGLLSEREIRGNRDQSYAESFTGVAEGVFASLDIVCYSLEFSSSPFPSSSSR